MATSRGNGRKFCFLGSNGDSNCVLARLSHTIDHPPNPPPVLGEDMIDTGRNGPRRPILERGVTSSYLYRVRASTHVARYQVRGL